MQLQQYVTQSGRKVKQVAQL